MRIAQPQSGEMFIDHENPSCARLQGQELDLISEVHRRGALNDNFQVGGASYFRVVGNDDDAGHWQSMLHSFVGMPRDGINVVSDYDAALARGPVDQGRIAPGHSWLPVAR